MNQNCTLEFKDRIETGLLSGKMKMARHANALTQKTEIPPLCRGQPGTAFGDTMPQSRLRGTPQPTREKQRNHNSKSPTPGQGGEAEHCKQWCARRHSPENTKPPHHISPCAHAQPATESAEHRTGRRRSAKIPHEASEREPTGTQPKVSSTVSVDAPPEEAGTASREKETERENRGSEQVKNISQKEKSGGKIR